MTRDAERRVLLLDEETCTGCMLCVLGCAIACTGESDPARSRIRVCVGGEEGSFVPLTCQHCERAFCAEACPTGACHREEASDIVVIDEERCIGCRTCIVACPFGAPSFDRKAGVSVKCDCCDGDPRCVGLCETGAIRYVRADESSVSKRREVALRRVRRHEGSSETGRGERPDHPLEHSDRDSASVDRG
jgi:carbon-monoxide dehydrogenase iron sulfur subunit